MIEHDQQLHVDTALVSKGVHSSDACIVENILRTQAPKDRYKTMAWVTTDLTRSINTRGLDRVMKNRLKSRLNMLRCVFENITNHECELRDIQRMPEGYPQYQATMVALGKDPLTFHEWEEIQGNLKEDVR